MSAWVVVVADGIWDDGPGAVTGPYNTQAEADAAARAADGIALALRLHDAGLPYGIHRREHARYDRNLAIVGHNLETSWEVEGPGPGQWTLSVSHYSPDPRTVTVWTSCPWEDGASANLSPDQARAAAAALLWFADLAEGVTS